VEHEVARGHTIVVGTPKDAGRMPFDRDHHFRGRDCPPRSSCNLYSHCLFPYHAMRSTARPVDESEVNVVVGDAVNVAVHALSYARVRILAVQ